MSHFVGAGPADLGFGFGADAGADLAVMVYAGGGGDDMVVVVVVEVVFDSVNSLSLSLVWVS